jgi:uncharacterized protein with von Willebrand factor type A (vWA) domain
MSMPRDAAPVSAGPQPAGPAGTRPGEPVLAALLALVADLRRAGVDVPVAGGIDAARALLHLDLADRSVLRAGLRGTLVKRRDDVAVFDELFDRWFPLASTEPVPVASPPTHDTNPGPERRAHDGTTMRSRLLASLESDARDDLRLLVQEAVDEQARGDVRAGERSLLHRVLRALDLAELLVAAMRDLRRRATGMDELALLLERDELRARIEELRRLVEAEVRARIASDSGPARTGLVAPPKLDEVAVAGATNAQLREMRAAVRPLARKLAARLGAGRRRHGHGRLDMRHTMRRSLKHGGVPLEPVLRRRRASKPDLVVLCDVSGSVAEYARFTLMLLHAMRDELAGLRAFVFVDGVAEITEVLRTADVVPDPRLLVTLPGVVAGDGHTDYEAVWRRFLAAHGTAVTPRTTVVVIGDARTNFRDPGVATFRQLCERARRVLWFDPEPATEWDDPDCALALYRDDCDGVFEVGTLAQLSKAVEAIA